MAAGRQLPYSRAAPIALLLTLPCPPHLPARSGGDEEEEEDLSGNKIVQFCRSLMSFTDAYDGDKFFTAAVSRPCHARFILASFGTQRPPPDPDPPPAPPCPRPAPPVQSGVRQATPLLLVLLVVELSDVVFAVDSIPAVSRQTALKP